MRRITVRELHMHTGEWVRKAAEERIVITQRGTVMAALMPIGDGEEGTLFGERTLLPELAKMPRIHVDSTAFISQDRDRS